MQDWKVTYELEKDDSTIVKVPDFQGENGEEKAIENLQRQQGNWYVEDIHAVKPVSKEEGHFRVVYSGTMVDSTIVEASDRDSAKTEVGKTRGDGSHVSEFYSVRKITTEDSDVGFIRELEEEDEEDEDLY